MPAAQVSALQLHLFASDSPAYQDALARYEAIRPVLKRERTLAQQSRATGLSYWRLWRDLRRFRRAGLLGLVDRRTLPHRAGQDLPIEELLPVTSSSTSCRWPSPIPSPLASWRGSSGSAITTPSITGGSSGCSSGITSPPRCCSAIATGPQQAPFLPWPPDPQLGLPFEPTHPCAQRLAHALGPEHLLIRFRTYREYPTEEQARWRIIELLEVGFRPRRVAELLAIEPAVVYYWKRRFNAAGSWG